MSHYDAWIAAELTWAEPFRRLRVRAWRKAMLKIAGIFLAGTAVIVICMYFSSDSLGEALGGGLVFLTLGVLIMGPVALLIPGQTGTKFFRKRLEKCVRRLNLTAEQREDLAQDLLEAQRDSSRWFGFEEEKNRAPGRFILGKRWVFLSGGWEYNLMIRPLAGAVGFRPAEDAVVVGSGIIRFNYIFFEGQGPKAVLNFRNIRDRDQALAMLRAIK